MTGKSSSQPSDTSHRRNDSFLLDDEPKAIAAAENYWKIMIVDDDYEVHAVTKLVLDGFSFEGRRLAFLSAYSAQEAKELLRQNPDVAVILLDVVMEGDDAGLRLVRYIREELKNSLVRIVLRTGQPGHAPETKVIVEYDINDYKEKTELTAQKLFTTIVSSLRGFRDLTIIDANKRGLEKIIEASPTIFRPQSLKNFASGVLIQLAALLQLNKNALYCKSKTSSFAATRRQTEEFQILAATGDFAPLADQPLKAAVPRRVLARLEQALTAKTSLFCDDYLVVYHQSTNGSENLVYLEGPRQLDDLDKRLVYIFCLNVSAAFDNLSLNLEIEESQKEIFLTLVEVAEARSRETGNHVKRVGEYAKLLAIKSGLPEQEADILRLAAPMHDIGKLGVLDAVLNKAGRLTPEEFEVIKAHATLGHEMLKSSDREVMKAAAIIALQHHEKWDGTGYPNRLKGEDIHIYGRITAIADVFDALGCERVYKKAWPLPDILDYFRRERGGHFDPALVDIFFENIDEILRIRDALADIKAEEA